MKNNKLISLFLFLVLSIQVLPIQRIAAWFFSNPVTEELAHSVNPVKAKSGTDEVHPPFSLHPCHSGIQAILASALANHHRDEALYVRHADDILSPPPNC
jgi:hypothetical protein